MNYFKEKNFHLSEGPFFYFFLHKNQKKIETPQKKEKYLSKNNLGYIFTNPKLHET
jgi:hypothetical protein